MGILASCDNLLPLVTPIISARRNIYIKQYEKLSALLISGGDVRSMTIGIEHYQIIFIDGAIKIRYLLIYNAKIGIVFYE